MMLMAVNTEQTQRDMDVNLIINKALEAVNPYGCTMNVLALAGERLKINESRLNLNEFKHIYLIGTGKAVLPMASGVVDVLQRRISAGFLITKHANDEIQNKLGDTIQVRLGSHPVPSQKSVDSTKELVRFLEGMDEQNLVICLISGGGSALMSLPYEGISLADMQEVSRQLLLSGASINEMNAVRKHLDRVKGGGLARMVFPAKLVTLVLSDVLGDPLDVIASGPTVADPTTYADALAFLDKYHLMEEAPAGVLDHLKAGKQGELPETVKDGEACLQDTATYIIGSLPIAAKAALAGAHACGYSAEILTTKLEGEASRVGQEMAGRLKKMAEREAGPACLIAGGETTVTVRGQGKGGRNQETALSAALALQGLQDCLFVSLATDGEDGPTDAAGAFVDGSIIAEGEKLGLDASDYLARNDAYTYLEKTGNLIKIGPTGTNVNDLILMFAFD